jgi:lysine 6-dehydrogenase
MKLLILGSGLMGPAAAFNAASQPDVAQVVLCDLDQQQLESAIKRFVGTEVAAKLGVVRLDLSHQEAAAQLVAKFDAVVAALPRTASPLGIRAALQAGVPLVDLTRPNEDEVKALKQAAHAAGGLIILGCGVEPGLTEILARHLAEKLDRVDELHIKVGGIPAEPAPPLGYKIVFGGRQLPLREQDGHVVEAGELKLAPRYSAVERVVFDGVGECEAWQENLMPWLLDLSAFKGLKNGTQKTIRWPGYAAKVRVLKELGLLNQEPVEVDGVSVVPKNLVDAVLYPRVKLNPGERDLTLFRVEVSGQKGGQPASCKAEMIDRYDGATGFTSMARTTAFTGAIVALMIVRGDIQARGLTTPEQPITGPLFDRLLAELAAVNIRFEITETAGG